MPLIQLQTSWNVLRLLGSLTELFTQILVCLLRMEFQYESEGKMLHSLLGVVWVDLQQLTARQKQKHRSVRQAFGSGSENQLAKSTEVPVWSGFNSLVSDAMPVTRIGPPPLIAAPAHDWQTLLTVLMQAQNRKTVISLGKQSFHSTWGWTKRQRNCKWLAKI